MTENEINNADDVERFLKDTDDLLASQEGPDCGEAYQNEELCRHVYNEWLELESAAGRYRLIDSRQDYINEHWPEVKEYFVSFVIEMREGGPDWRRGHTAKISAQVDKLNRDRGNVSGRFRWHDGGRTYFGR